MLVVASRFNLPKVDTAVLGSYISSDIVTGSAARVVLTVFRQRVRKGKRDGSILRL